MSDINCSACNDLREYAPHFVQNGVTSTECNSLMNDTGLNPSVSPRHTNCDDLHDVNDCLIGRMDGELEAYEVCDWKKFMHRFLPNLYETEKAIICGDCGQWLQIHDLDDRVEDICALLHQILFNNMDPYGILTGSRYVDDTDRMGGEIMTKNGVPLLTKTNDGLFNRVGFYYRRERYRNCDGETKTYEWIQPTIAFYTCSNNIAYDDVVYQVPRSYAHEQWGMTDALLDWLRDYPQWRGGYHSAFGLYHDATFMFCVEDDYLRVKLIGSSGAMANVNIDADEQTPALVIS